MLSSRTYFSRWYQLLLLAPLPGLVALAAAITVESIPLPTILAFAVIAYAVLVAGATEARKAGAEQQDGWAASEPELMLMDTVPLMGASATLGVASTAGVCPLGFGPGDSWAIDPMGQLSSQLCRPAVEALSGLARGASAEDLEHQVSCLCPLADRQVVFTLRSNGHQRHAAPVPGAPAESWASQDRMAA